MRPDGQARRASISGIFEHEKKVSVPASTGCSAGRMYRYIELRTLVGCSHDSCSEVWTAAPGSHGATREQIGHM